MIPPAELEKFIELQYQDKRLAAALARVDELPQDIAAAEREFKARELVFESKKTHYKKLLITRKELEGELTAKEKLIDKHQFELNMVKSNDAFKALLSEIEKAKAEKNDIENTILKCLDDIDAEEKIQQPIKLDHTEDAEQTKKTIAALKAESEKLAALIDGLKAARGLHARTITDSGLLAKYENLLIRRGGIALSPAKRKPGGMICSLCNMALLPHQVSELSSGNSSVFCESCQRILYLPPQAD